MKLTAALLLLTIIATVVKAQDAPATGSRRQVKYKTIGRDSVIIPLNADYELIEDSCADMVRYGHFDRARRVFTGKFTDVSKLNPDMVTAEGFYTAEGLKDGFFTAHYANGTLRSKGAYKNGNYNGRWEAYYDNGKPKLTFDAINDTVKIIDAWDTEGKKTIENGKGAYTVNIVPLTWKGKLENGRPDGTWHAYKTDDARQISLVDEIFKKGKFQNGSSPGGKYTDASRITLIPANLFTYDNAERMHISTVPCNGVKRKHIVNAQYDNGLSSFSEFIKVAVGPYIRRFDVRTFQGQLVLEGVISEYGLIINLMPVTLGFQEDFTRGLINEFRKVPALQPATADGVPVKQKIRITFNFESGIYRFSYKFLAIDRGTLQ